MAGGDGKGGERGVRGGWGGGVSIGLEFSGGDLVRWVMIWMSHEKRISYYLHYAHNGSCIGWS